MVLLKRWGRKLTWGEIKCVEWVGMWVHAELEVQNFDLHHQYIIVLEGFGLFGQRGWTPKWHLEMYLT